MPSLRPTPDMRAAVCPVCADTCAKQSTYIEDPELRVMVGNFVCRSGHIWTTRWMEMR